jgi:Ser/Thr protein kinase RdoA (MazF antagonist)
MKPYKELSRRGRLRRLREVAELALDTYGIKDAELKFLQYTQNGIYRVNLPVPQAPDANSPYLSDRYVLRLHAMRDADAIASELTWLAALNQAAGLPVPAPVPMPDGFCLKSLADDCD